MKEFLDVSLFGGAVLSLVGYEIGLILKKKFKMAVFNPLLIGVICVIAVLVVGNISYESYNQSGKYISYLLTPATVCLAVPLYEQLELLKKNLKAVAAGLISGVLASLVGVLILAKLFGLSHEQYVTMLPKSKIHYNSNWNGDISRTWWNCNDYRSCYHCYRNPWKYDR